MKEVIKDYFATEDGKIWSKKTNTFVAQRIHPRGYHIVNLSIEGKCKTYLVHRLVAKAFIPNPNNYPTINHKDGNKLNNNINNLEWCSYKYNTQHAIVNGLRHNAIGLNTKHGHFTVEDIKNIHLLKQQGLSQSKIANKYGVTRGAIQQILKGTTYRWIE